MRKAQRGVVILAVHQSEAERAREAEEGRENNPRAVDEVPQNNNAYRAVGNALDQVRSNAPYLQFHLLAAGVIGLHLAYRKSTR